MLRLLREDVDYDCSADGHLHHICVAKRRSIGDITDGAGEQGGGRGRVGGACQCTARTIMKGAVLRGEGGGSMIMVMLVVVTMMVVVVGKVCDCC